MRSLPPLLLAALVLLVGACASETETAEIDTAATTGDEPAAQMETIRQQRSAIEARVDDLTRYTVSTDTLREQIRQKWSELHFYAAGDTLLRVKTYPHEDVSTRTEEFYFEDGELIAAVIQDAGTTADENAAGQKAYYYADGEFVGEQNDTDEPEQSVRTSDAERLQAEAMEYLDLFQAQVAGE